MVLWILGGVGLAVFLGAFTIVWWKLGDIWADEEYKKFGHGGGSPKSDTTPTVISDFDSGAPDTNQRDAG